MPSRIVEIGCKHGLHTHPAALIAKAAEEAGIPVTIGRPGETGVDATSMIMLVALGAEHGEKLEVVVENAENSEAILDEIVDILATDYDV